jgi:hypothetical protein
MPVLEGCMGNDTWAQRMSQRAAIREAARQAEAETNDPHRDHHTHLIGTSVYCSCGEFQGITCVVVPFFETAEEEDEFYDSLVCDLCGQRGLVRVSNG